MSKQSILKLLSLIFAATMIATACGSDATDAADDATDAVGDAADDVADEAGDAADEAGDAADDVADEVTGDDPAMADCAAGDINISGSSTVEPISTRVAELYESVCPDTFVNVDGPGTGDGFQLFCSGETDISDASRAIKDSEAEDCAANGIEFAEIKVAFDGIAVMTNPANEAVACLAFADLYALLGGESNDFSNWSDANDLAASLGSTVAPYPDAELVISGPGTESGTYDSFIEIVLEGLAEEQQGEDAQAVRDFAGNAEDNVIIEGIAGSDSSLGWVGFAFAHENADRVKTLAVSAEPGGDCVEPTFDTIADGSYPVSRALYIYVNKEKLESNPALAGYVDFYLNDGYVESVTKAFGESGYVTLPDDQLAESKSALS